MIKNLLRSLVVLLALCAPALATDDAMPTSWVHCTNCGTSSTAPIFVTGNVAGFGNRVTSVPTVQNASYSSGNCMGGFNSVTFAKNNGDIVILNDVTVKSVTGVTPSVVLYIFDANPSASTCTDKSTFTINSADVTKMIGPFALTLAAPTGTSVTNAEAPNLGRIFFAGGSAASGVKTFYYALVAASTVTPGSTTDIQVGFQGITGYTQ